MAEKNIESRPTNICGHSAVMYFTEQTKRQTPNIIPMRPARRMLHLFIFDTGEGQSSFLAGNQDEIADVDNRPQTLPENKYRVLFMYRVGQ